MTKQSESILTKFQKTHENTRVQVILFLAGGSLDKLLTLCEFTAGETENRVMKSEMPSAQDWFEMLCVNVSSKCYTVITVSCPYIYGNNVKLKKNTKQICAIYYNKKICVCQLMTSKWTGNIMGLNAW